MGFFSKLFGRKSKASVALDLGFAKVEQLSDSDNLAVLLMHGIEKSPAGAMTAVLVEPVYLASQKCTCGGAWTKQGGASAYPVAHVYCVCSTCHAKKTFEFRFK